MLCMAKCACVCVCVCAMLQALKAYFGESPTCTVHSFFQLLGKLIAVRLFLRLNRSPHVMQWMHWMCLVVVMMVVVESLGERKW
jgi:hypothetical protein